MSKSKTTKTKSKTIKIGGHPLRYGTKVTDMRDSTDLYNSRNYVAMRRRLAEDGFVFIKGVIPSKHVSSARIKVLEQIFSENGIIITDKYALNDAVISKNKSTYSDGYCIDVTTGSETHQRPNIDTEKWEQISSCQTLQSIYCGEHIRTLWGNLFGKANVKPLPEQTFLRAIGDDYTIPHSDLYYFKKDTEILDNIDGQSAQKAEKDYLESQNLWKSDIFEVKEYSSDGKETENDEQTLCCGMCGLLCLFDDLDNERKERLQKSYGRKNDFGMKGSWYCPKCSASPLGVYTTWMCLSELTAPQMSILAVCPKSHLLKKWDLPQTNKQLPGDFNWKMPWEIPKSISYGDVIIFNIKTVHASSANNSSPKAFRVSLDTRMQIIPAEK